MRASGLPGFLYTFGGKGGLTDGILRLFGKGDVLDGAVNAATKVDYFLPVPGRPTGYLVMAFGTPMAPLADALALLFDAIARRYAGSHDDGTSMTAFRLVYLASSR